MARKYDRNTSDLFTSGRGSSQLILISEAGLYTLVMRAQKSTLNRTEVGRGYGSPVNIVSESGLYALVCGPEGQPETSKLPWFVAKDVCRHVGPTNAPVAVRPLSPDQKAKKFIGGLETNSLRTLRSEQVRPITPGTFRGKGMSLAKLVSESGLYTLVMRAQKANPKAAEFQSWVTGTVLPTIRQTGGYIKSEEKLATGNAVAEITVWVLRPLAAAST